MWLVVAGEAWNLKAHVHTWWVDGWMDGTWGAMDDERGEGLFVALTHGHVDRQTDRERSVAMPACRGCARKTLTSCVLFLPLVRTYTHSYRQSHLTVYATDLLSSLIEMLLARPAVFCQFTRAARRWLRGSPLSLTDIH